MSDGVDDRPRPTVCRFSLLGWRQVPKALSPFKRSQDPYNSQRNGGGGSTQRPPRKEGRKEEDRLSPIGRVASIEHTLRDMRERESESWHALTCSRPSFKSSASAISRADSFFSKRMPLSLSVSAHHVRMVSNGISLFRGNWIALRLTSVKSEAKRM